jgi:hypothetical protein
MNTFTATWGGLLAASGVVMHFLLLGLGQESFFMSAVYLPPAQIASYGVIAAGVALLIASFVTGWPRYVEVSNDVASRYFGRIALVNALAAAIFAAPMLVPSLELPILLTEWPGIYILIAYTFFVIFGVLGMLAWSVLYHLAPVFFSRRLLDRRSVILQLVLSEVGIYSVSSVLFAAGYTGASLAHDGKVGPVFIGASMEFSDIPAAISIFIIIVSVFLGAAIILYGKGKPTEVRAFGDAAPSASVLLRAKAEGSFGAAELIIGTFKKGKILSVKMPDYEPAPDVRLSRSANGENIFAKITGILTRD